MMLVYENNNYIVETGDSLVLEGAITYICKNKYTGVIEIEEQMLPKVIDYADQLDTATAELMKTVTLFPGKKEH